MSGRQLFTASSPGAPVPVDMLCSAAAGGILLLLEVSAPALTIVSPVVRNRWSQVNEQGSGKATRVQVAGLWIAAGSLALALLRTVFDVLEVLGR